METIYNLLVYTGGAALCIVVSVFAMIWDQIAHYYWTKLKAAWHDFGQVKHSAGDW